MAGQTQVHRIDVVARDSASRTLEAGARRVQSSQRALRSSLSATEAASRAADRSIERYGRAAASSARGSRSAEDANRALDRSLERLVGSSARAARAHRQQASAAAAANREVKRLGASARGSMGMLVGGASVGFAGAAIVRTAGAYQTALRDAGAQAEIHGKRLERLGVVSRKVGLEQAVGAKASAAAAGELAKAGVSYEQVVTGALKSTMDLAKAGGTEVPLAADAMAAALSDFNMAGTEAAHVADSLTNSSLSTRDSVEGVTRAFASGSAAAREVGYSFDDTVTTLTLLAKRGQLAAVGGTTMRSAFLRLINPPKAARAAIEEYNLSLYDSHGRLKRSADLSDELREKLKGLTDVQKAAVFKDLAGSYGFRALSAIAHESGDEINKLEARLKRQGVAARIAAERTTQYEGAISKLKAAGQEASIIMGGPLLVGIADTAEAFVGSLGSPAVRRALDRFGRQVGEKGSAFAAGFEASAKDGRLEGALDDALATTDAIVDSAAAVAKAVGAIASLWQQVPEPIRESGVQALVFAAVLRRIIALGGALPFVGGAAAVAAARGGGAAGAARTATAPVPILAGRPGFPPAAPAAAAATTSPAAALAAARVQQSTAVRQYQQTLIAQQALAARQAAARPATPAVAAYGTSAAARARALGSATAPGVTGRNPLLVRAQAAERDAARAATTAAREQARTASAAAASARQAAAAQRGPTLRTRMTPTRAGVGRGAGVAAIGAGAAALSGGNTMTAAMSGAMVGSMLGPIGIVGGAAGAALVSEASKYFKKRGRDEARAMGEELGKGIGKGLDGKAIDRMVGREKALAKAKPTTYTDANGQRVTYGDSAAYRGLQRAQANDAATAQRKTLGKAEFVDVNAIRKDTLGRFGKDNVPATMRAQGAAAAVAYAEGLKGKNKLSRQEMKGLIESLSQDLKIDAGKLQQAARSVRIGDAFKAEAGEAKSALQGLLDENAKRFAGLQQPARIGFQNAVGEGERQLAELLAKTKTGSRAQREAAQAEYDRLKAAIAEFSRDASGSLDRFGAKGAAVADGVTAAFKNTKDGFALLQGQMARGAGAIQDGFTTSLTGIAKEATKGRQTGRKGVAERKAVKYETVRGLAADFLRVTKGDTEEARKAASVPYITYARELEKSGKLTRGASDRLKRQMGKTIDVPVAVAAKAELRVDLNAAGGKLRKKIVAAIRKNETLKDVPIATTAQLDITNLPKAIERQKKALESIAYDPAKSKAERKRAADGLLDLTKLGKEFGDKTADAQKRAARAIKAAADAVQQQNDDVSASWVRRREEAERTLAAEAGQDLPLRDYDPSRPASPVPNPRTGRVTGARSGGEVRRRFNAGGVAVAASPGELMEFPDGSSAIVPGHRIAADNVYMTVPDRTRFYTDHGQQLLAAGASRQEALDQQMPHFRRGGEVQKFAAGGIAGIGAIAAQAKRVLGNNEKAVTATAITGPESGGNPRARLKTAREDSRGWWQINTLAHPKWARRNLYNGAVNADAMDEISSNGTNFGPWTGFTSGKYRAFLTAARAAVRGTSAAAGSGISTSRTGTIRESIMVGASKRNRLGIVADAFGQAFQRAASGVTRADVRRYRGLGPAEAVQSAMDAVEVTRERQTRVATAPSRSSSSSSPASGPGIGGRGWGRPVAGPITSRYGRRSSPGGVGSTNHDGIDFGVPVGTPVKAARYGTVTKAGPNGGYGNYVGLSHAGGYGSFYGHLSSIVARVGDRVRKGQTIAKSGNTGTSTGPHLHFGMSKNAASVDPASVISFRRGGTAGKKTTKPRAAGPSAASILRQVRGQAEDFLPAIDASLEGLALSRVWALREAIQRIANGKGRKVDIKRAQTALTAFDDELGERAGTMVARSTQLLTTRETNRGYLSQLQRIRGTAGTQAGIAEEAAQERAYLQGAPAARKKLMGQLASAERSGDKSTVDGLRDALKALDDQALDSQANLAELGRAASEAAAAEVEAATSRRADALSRGGRMAATTATLDDDIANAGAVSAEAWANAQRYIGDAEKQAEYATQFWESQANLIGLQTQQAEQRAQKVIDDRAAPFLDLDIAADRAKLTDTRDDDIQVARDFEAASRAALASAEAAGDRDEISKYLKQVVSAVEGVKAEVAAQGESNEEKLQRLLEQAEERARQAEAGIAGANAATRAFADFINADLGGAVRATRGLGNHDPRSRVGR